MKIDYNAIAKQYSQHRRIHPGVLRGLLEKTTLNAENAVLEVGCGTGNYILALRSASGCQGWGADPSEKMLAIARERDEGVNFVPGEAETLAFPDETFDLLFSVDVIHHVQGRESFILEAGRVLKPGGWLCTITEDDALIRSRVPLARYFPETIEYELARYPGIEDLRDWMQAAGFEHLKREIVSHPYQINDLAIYEAKAFSILHLIPEQSFQQGLLRMRADLEKGPIQAVSHYLMLWGKKANAG